MERIGIIGFSIAIAIAGAIALFAMVLNVLELYLNPVGFFQRNDLIKSVASVLQALGVSLAGAVGLTGIYFTWRNLNQTQESTERQLQLARRRQEQTQINADKTLWLTEQGQITERFTRAVEQLAAIDDQGEKRLEIRLGGIYALERIATDSAERDYGTVMQVLTAYVRENAPYIRENGPPDIKKDADQNQASKTDRVSIQSASQKPRFNMPKPSIDIQTILDVISRLKKLEQEDFELSKQPVTINLSESNLAGARLNHGTFSEVYFFQTNLFRAHLVDANLSDANFCEADLSNPILVGANLSQAHLVGANLSKADLSTAEGLTAEQLGGARGDAFTRLPSGFIRPTSWTEDRE